MDECKIVRWLILSDVFQPAEEIKYSAVFPTLPDVDPSVTRWMLDSDTWSVPKPSEVFPAPATNEIKIVQWQTDKDIWGRPLDLTKISLRATPTHLYSEQHVYCLVDYTAVLDQADKPVKVLLNSAELKPLSLDRSVSIPVADFIVGDNKLELAADDGAVASCNVLLEEKHRTIVERTFTSIDGGYITKEV